MIPLQELLQLCGVGYPCVLTLVQSWLFLPVWGGPFALRSLRVLIATSNGERRKSKASKAASLVMLQEGLHVPAGAGGARCEILALFSLFAGLES